MDNCKFCHSSLPIGDRPHREKFFCGRSCRNKFYYRTKPELRKRLLDNAKKKNRRMLSSREKSLFILGFHGGMSLMLADKTKEEQDMATRMLYNTHMDLGIQFDPEMVKDLEQFCKDFDTVIYKVIKDLELGVLK